MYESQCWPLAAVLTPLQIHTLINKLCWDTCPLHQQGLHILIQNFQLFPQIWSIAYYYSFFNKLQLAQCSQKGNILLASTKSRLAHQSAKQRSMICHSTELISTAPVQLQHALHCLALLWCQDCMQMLGHGNLFQHEVLMPVEVWNLSSMSVGDFCAPCTLMIPWYAVHKHFSFPVIIFTVDHGISEQPICFHKWLQARC